MERVGSVATGDAAATVDESPAAASSAVVKQRSALNGSNKFPRFLLAKLCELLLDDRALVRLSTTCRAVRSTFASFDWEARASAAFPSEYSQQWLSARGCKTWSLNAVVRRSQLDVSVVHDVPLLDLRDYDRATG